MARGNCNPETARAALIVAAQRVNSGEESIRNLLNMEPRLTAYLDHLTPQFRKLRWEIKEAGENVHLLYAKIWPMIDFNAIDLSALAEQAPPLRIGHIHVSPRDGGWPFRRTGRPKPSWEEEDDQ